MKIFLLFIISFQCQFYLKVDFIERCLVDSFKKNQEVII